MKGTPAVSAIADRTGPNQAMGLEVAGHVAYAEVVTSQYIEKTEDNFGNNGTRVSAHLRAVTGPRLRRWAHWPPPSHWPGRVPTA